MAVMKAALFLLAASLVQQPGEAEAAPRKKGPRRWYLSPVIGVVSWQEPLSLNYSDGTVYPALSSTAAICAGTSALFRLGKRSELDLSACFLSGAASAALKTSSTAVPIAYEARSIAVLGGRASIGYFVRPASGNVTLGLTVPLVFRSVDFPSPEAGSSISAGSALRAGAMLDARFFVGRLFLSTKVGFLGKPGAMAWGLEGGYLF